jgi:LEA14-like dessication related protein
MHLLVTQNRGKEKEEGMRRRRFIAAFAAVAALSGCASLGMLGGFKEPIVSFKDLRLAGIGLNGGSMDVYLNVYNPNGFKLDATRLTYKLLVGEEQLALGALDSRFTVQNGDSTTVRIPVDFTFSGISAVAKQLMNTGTANYRVTGDVNVGTPIGTFTVPYDQTGRFSILGGVR